MPNHEVLLLEVAGGVATVTLNRPQQRNALSSELLRILVRTIGECQDREDVSVVILTGADPAFCAGLDLTELAASNTLLRGDGEPESASAPAKASDHRRRRLGPFPSRRKPLIGAVNGSAVTGGLELALACDFLVASDRARFADTHARVGVQPAWGLTVLLPQAVGLRRAREMSATGNFIDAETAQAWGLVNRVVSHEELLPTALALSADIAGNDAAGVQRVLATYAEGSLLSPAEAWKVELAASAEWLRDGHGRPDEVAARKQAVTDRGRSQVEVAGGSGPPGATPATEAMS